MNYIFYDQNLSDSLYTDANKKVYFLTKNKEYLSISEILEKYNTPFYLYLLNQIEKNLNTIFLNFENIFSDLNIQLKVFFSIKSNNNWDIINFMYKNLNIGFETVSSNEVKYLIDNNWVWIEIVIDFIY